MNKVLVKYSQDCYYGVLSGLFITTDEDLLRLNGTDVYFGGVLGKHSEVVLNNTYDYCEVVSDNISLINYLELVFESKNLSGYNPLDYLYDIEEGFNEVPKMA